MTTVEPNTKYLDSDATSSFYLIEGSRYRVQWTSGGTNGRNHVYLWIRDLGWTEVATYSAPNPSQTTRASADRRAVALWAHDLLTSGSGVAL